MPGARESKSILYTGFEKEGDFLKLHSFESLETAGTCFFWRLTPETGDLLFS